MDKLFKTILVVKDKSSKILLGSSSASSAYATAEVGVAVELETQSSTNVDVIRLHRSSCQSDMESLQLPLGVVYNCDGSQW